MIAKNAAEAAKVPTDMAARMAADKLIRDTYQTPSVVPEIDLPETPPENPTVYLAMEDIRVSTIGSGPFLIRRGTKIDNPRVIYELLAAKANIKPLK
jgi:hypothetical protein